MKKFDGTLTFKMQETHDHMFVIECDEFKGIKAEGLTIQEAMVSLQSEVNRLIEDAQAGQAPFEGMDLANGHEVSMEVRPNANGLKGVAINDNDEDIIWVPLRDIPDFIKCLQAYMPKKPRKAK